MFVRNILKRIQSKRNLRVLSSRPTMEEIERLCKNKGFVYQSAGIYGGFSHSYDYGPLGTMLKSNLRNLWWREFILKEKDCVPIETPIITHPKVWEVTGHVNEFMDAIVQCKSCKHLYRADHIIEEAIGEPVTVSDAAGLQAKLRQHQISCSHCKESLAGEPVRNTNLMFETTVGPQMEGRATKSYLRPETAQGIMLNFDSVVRSQRKKLPFGIGQIGKSFRNELAPSNFLFRSREFEQLELEYFCDGSEQATEQFDRWLERCEHFLLHHVGLNAANVRRTAHHKEQLAHYSNATVDLEYRYPFGWGEIWGISNRGDYDIGKHMEASGADLRYRDPQNPSRRIVPHVVEPALGLDRLLLAVLIDCYSVEEIANNSKRIVMRFPQHLAPYQCAILPLTKDPRLLELAERVFLQLLDFGLSVDYDEAGSIGRRYRRQDEIGTPHCLTVDFDSLHDHAITSRERDSMEQSRILIDQLSAPF